MSKKKHKIQSPETIISNSRSRSKKIEVFFWSVFALSIVAYIVFHIIMPSQDLIKEGNYNFPDVDSYYHLWQADYIYDNWPNIQTYTTMLNWPDGQNVGQTPLNSWLVATIAKFSGLTVNQVGFYWPAILGLFSVILVFLIGWLVWNKWAGLIAMASLSVMQGEFYGRLSVGVCDQHALEVFLTTLLILFIVLTFKNWKWSFGSGIMLGMYYLAWSGAPIYTVILLIVLVVQSIINKYRNVSNHDLTLSTLITLGMGFGLFAVWNSNDAKYIFVYGLSVLVPFIVQILSRYIKKPSFYIVSIIVAGIAGFTGIYFYNPELVKLTLVELQNLTATVGASAGSLGSTISEVQPLFAPYGEFTFGLVIGCFGLTFLFGIGGIILSFKTQGKGDRLTILVWTLMMFLITSFQRRFGYYLALNLCLMSGYFWWFILNKYGWREYSKKQHKEGLKGQYFSPVFSVLGVVLIIATIIVPNSMMTASVTHTHPYALTKAWQEGLEFIKDKTPQENTYGVISWWDYGYWILREGERPVPVHPGGGDLTKISQFFTTDTTEVANNIAKEIKCKYVVIDYQMAHQKFYAIPLLAGYKDYTEEQMNDSLLFRLYFSKDGINGYKEVFESSTKYDGQAQVKIYEIYDYQEPCRCGQ